MGIHPTHSLQGRFAKLARPVRGLFGFGMFGLCAYAAAVEFGIHGIGVGMAAWTVLSGTGAWIGIGTLGNQGPKVTPPAG